MVRASTRNGATWSASAWPEPPAILLRQPFRRSTPPGSPRSLRMPAKEQVEAVKAELMKRNPSFDGKMTPTINESGKLAELLFVTDDVTDISPIRALPWLRKLHVWGSHPTNRTGKLADLSPLKGMKLEVLQLRCTQVSDLVPLAEMKLVYLSCSFTKVSDLSPLTGMGLVTLYVNGTKVTDLSPLKGMPLKVVWCDYQAKRDVEILRSMKTLEAGDDQRQNGGAVLEGSGRQVKRRQKRKRIIRCVASTLREPTGGSRRPRAGKPTGSRVERPSNHRIDRPETSRHKLMT